MDEDGLDGAPWWVRTFVRVGAPTALMSVLIWFLMTDITGSQTRLETATAEIVRINATVIENQRRIMELLTEAKAEDAKVGMVLLAMCYNQTTNQVEVQRCTDAFR